MVSPPAAKYRRLVELGRGGMAAVYLAAIDGPQGFRKLVVVKEMKPELAQQDEFREMFFQEARVSARLHHPNVVQTYEVVEDPKGVYCIVMEFLDGHPLSRLLAATRNEESMLPLELHLVSETLAGLEYVHSLSDQGRALHLVHRDVSPQNVFVTYNGDIKLLDFGIAKSIDSSVQTELGTLKGKLAYMTPEQVMGRGIDCRTDVFAVGVMLWELLARRRLWANVPEPEIVGRLVSGAIPDLTTVTDEAPPELVAICRRALMAKKEERYATAAEMRRDIDTYARTLGPRASRADVASAMDRLFAEHRRALEKKIGDVLSGAVPPPETSTPLLPSTGLPTTVGTTEVIASGSSTPGTSKTLGGSPRPPPTQKRSVAIVAVLATAVVTFAIVFAVRAISFGGRAQAGPPDAPSSATVIVVAPAVTTVTPPLVEKDPPPIATLPAATASASARPPVQWVPITRPRPSATSSSGRRRDPSDLGY